MYETVHEDQVTFVATASEALGAQSGQTFAVRGLTQVREGLGEATLFTNFFCSS